MANIINLISKDPAPYQKEDFKSDKIGPYGIFTWFYQKLISKIKIKSANQIKLRQMDK